MKVELENMEFFSHHGCFDEERRIGNRFIVNLSVEYDMSKASQSDNLADALNYQELYNVIKEEMNTPSRLLEHVAARVCKQLKVKFPEISGGSVSIAKLNPPLGGQVGASKVTLEL